MKHKPIFVTGIGTGVGKTIISAILVENLKADYWKPIQSGDLDNTDTDRVRSLVANNNSIFHPEIYRLTQPFSPHKSAAIDNIVIDLNSITLPVTENRLIIEGAGGLMVPLNDNDLMIDLIEKFDAEVVLVSQNYLGSINHTLMSAEILEHRGIKLNKLIVSGVPNESSEAIISKHTKQNLIHIPHVAEMNTAAIQDFASTLIF
ncbi:dethiobiotin synthase [Daejeonella lutea]|uniref:ATP-dependent dethiobiotin synthetase BioD n=1 Tax=Daejeonella lutea TaxID=572036 RepID=A0A1T5B4A0_9SPHI|nr:dethiobiotin synthase [Daejeonella lutea]SKB41995.1 dethiobiotin synthetase [Daejeonella lutea]